MSKISMISKRRLSANNQSISAWMITRSSQSESIESHYTMTLQRGRRNRRENGNKSTFRNWELIPKSSRGRMTNRLQSLLLLSNPKRLHNLSLSSINRSLLVPSTNKNTEATTAQPQKEMIDKSTPTPPSQTLPIKTGSCKPPTAGSKATASPENSNKRKETTDSSCTGRDLRVG